MADVVISLLLLRLPVMTSLHLVYVVHSAQTARYVLLCANTARFCAVN